MWVRGLKLKVAIYALGLIASHPMWVRGLKRWLEHKRNNRWQVAPHVGAWIETPTPIDWRKCSSSHPMWVRGLKLIVERIVCHLTVGRTPCGCVD